MSARSRMTMRARIERNFASDDPYGQPGPPVWQTIVVDVPCYVWYATGTARRTDISDRQVVTVDMPGAIMPLDTDIDEEDRIREVTDRRGKKLFDMLYIDGAMPRKDHMSLRLRSYD